MKKITIAIDGPAGAGKSTVAKRVAAKLDLSYLDTGAMYRCAALLAVRADIHEATAESAEIVAALLQEVEINFGHGDPVPVLMDGEDVSKLIRTPEMSNLASALSAFSPVRAILAKRQQELVANGGYVLEGRDTTSVVAPHAELKIYLTASIEERAHRRHLELKAKGEEVDEADLIRQIAERDARDMNRADSPLVRVADAVVIETYGLDSAQVVDRIIEAAKAL